MLTQILQLALAFNESATQERIEHVTLQSDSAPATVSAELAGGSTRTLPEEPADHDVLVVGRAPVVIPDLIAPPKPIDQMYLQLWFAPACEIEPLPRILGSTTTTPVPYGLANSCPSLEIPYDSEYYGTYDSRMDPDITTVTLPAILSKVINFRDTFSGVPVVAVWLTGLSSTTGAVVSVQATATNITTTQFTVQIDSSCGENLLSVGAAWVAWARDTKMIVGSMPVAGPNYASLRSCGNQWTMQLAVVCGVELGLEQDALVLLKFHRCESGNHSTRWSLWSGHQNSATVVYVMAKD